MLLLDIRSPPIAPKVVSISSQELEKYQIRNEPTFWGVFLLEKCRIGEGEAQQMIVTICNIFITTP